jgi:hypothetical protein
MSEVRLLMFSYYLSISAVSPRSSFLFITLENQYQVPASTLIPVVATCMTLTVTITTLNWSQ